MNSIYHAKRLFIGKVKSVLQVQKDDFDSTPCKLVDTTFGYRLLYKINETEYIDILSKTLIKSLDSIDIEKNDLIIENVKPLYRYAKSLRICEYKKDVETYADCISKYFNLSYFNFNHINSIVKECHRKIDANKQPLNKKQLFFLLSFDNKLVEVDDLFVVTTKIIDKVDRYTSEGHTYDYKLAVRKVNGKYTDPLTNKEIKQFSNKIKVGDIIIENVRPLYRYAKSLRIQEDVEDVKTYAKFVKAKFNSKEFKEDHSRFYEINELVKTCHRLNEKEEDLGLDI